MSTLVRKHFFKIENDFFVNYQLDEQNDKIALSKYAHC